MAKVVLTLGDDSRLHGTTPAYERAWRRFRALRERMRPGDTLHFTWAEPRDPVEHRRFFGALNGLFERQEMFADVEMLRAWVIVGAGMCDFCPGPNGQLVAVPQSIAYHELDEADFQELVRRVREFLRTSRAQEYLWPHLSAERRLEMIDGWEIEFW